MTDFLILAVAFEFESWLSFKRDVLANLDTGDIGDVLTTELQAGDIPPVFTDGEYTFFWKPKFSFVALNLRLGFDPRTVLNLALVLCFASFDIVG
jgi:hypothetical protein